MNNKILIGSLSIFVVLMFSVGVYAVSEFVNVDVTGFMNITKDNIAFEVSNSSENRVLRVNTTSGKLQVWDANEAAGDYIELYHDGTSGAILTGSGTLNINPAGGIVGLQSIQPLGTDDIGVSTNEWRGLYLRENASSGVYFGLDQDFQILMNETGGVNELRLLDSSGNEYIRVTDITSIGDGTDSHSLSSSDDLHIAGKLEVEGTSYFDGTATFSNPTFGTIYADNVQEIMGSATDTILDWSTAQATSNTIVWALGADSKSVIFSQNPFQNKDFDHPDQSDPTLFIQSAEDPDTSNVNWTSISHDGVDAVIDSGVGSISLEDSTRVEGNLTVGDKIGNVAVDMWDDGSYFKITTDNEVQFSNNITTSDGATVWSNSTCLFLSSPDGSTTTEICNA